MVLDDHAGQLRFLVFKKIRGWKVILISIAGWRYHSPAMLRLAAEAHTELERAA